MNKMKKNFLMFAALVATTLGFTACSSDDGLASAEQGQEQERGVVKTQFTISIPQASSGTTRMTAAVVQNAGTLAQFRGITGIRLYPFNTKVSNETTTKFPTDDIAIPSTIKLYGPTTGTTGKSGPSGNGDNTIGGQANLYKESTSHLYQDVDIPIGTRSFMFYGIAPQGNETPANFYYGALDHNLDPKVTSTTTIPAASKLGEITFSPYLIYSTNDAGTIGKNIAAYLTDIANVNNKAWKNTKNVGLASLYEKFTSMKSGAWVSVKAALQEMYKELKPREADSEETQTLKNAIRTAISSNTTYVTSVNSTTDVITFNSTVPNYPRDLDLPDGAAYILWNAPDDPGDKFAALKNNHNTGMNTPSLNSYAFPASLYYRVFSNIKTSTTVKGTTGDQAYDDTKTWETIKGYYNQTEAEAAAQYDNESVSSKTRSIIITDPIQYAVGRLDAKVIATASSLEDNSTNNTFGVNEATETSNIKVTGILIGGQNSVNYMFTPKGTENLTIYDTSINDSPFYLLYNAESPKTNYTLVLETKDATGNATNDAIKIAVEFENNTGKTIMGKNNELIHNGCRFYLIGSLDPNANTSYYYQDTSTLIKKAFVQDYTTTVTLKVNTLKNAYHTLPDLNVPQLEMGLSVDLGWKPGIIQSIDLE